MLNINNFEEFIAQYPMVECEGMPKGTRYQLNFVYPRELRTNNEGIYIRFRTLEDSTYFETEGAAWNAGVYKMPKRYTDLELYELVYHYFNLQVKGEI